MGRKSFFKNHRCVSYRAVLSRFHVLILLLPLLSSCIAKFSLESLSSSITSGKVKIISPLDNTYVNKMNYKNFPIRGTCAAEGEVVQLSGVVEKSFICNQGVWEGLLDFTSAPEGNIEIILYVKDEGESIATQSQQVIRLFKDTVPPLAPIILSVGSVGSDFTRSPSLTSLDGMDVGSGLWQNQVRVVRLHDSQEVVGWRSFASGEELVGLNLEFNSNYFFQMRSIDKAQNYSESFADSTLWALANPPRPEISMLDRFVWIDGSDDLDPAGVYGTKGMSDPSNRPGGRDSMFTWRTSNGDRWLFGGYACDKDGHCSVSDDLWRYSEATSQWTWMSGSDEVGAVAVYGSLGMPSASNTPGARSRGVAWVDSDENLWLFGGASRYDDLLNDLWKFNTISNEWVWMGGSDDSYSAGVYGTKGIGSTANIPGARRDSVAWADTAGKFWLFGGRSVDSLENIGSFNDLWQFDPSTSQWTWVSGDKTIDSPGVYGNKGVPSVANTPGARVASFGWVDKNEMFWLFGGNGFDLEETDGLLNDLWRFNPATNEWAWVSGADTVEDLGDWGTKGEFNISNRPDARTPGAVWIDNNNNFYLYGGASDDGDRNDLWVFNPTISLWSWVGGSQLVDQPAQLGVQGVLTEGAWPAGICRDWCDTGIWSDGSGNVWLMGGYYKDLDGGWGNYDTTWKYSSVNLGAEPILIGAPEVETEASATYSAQGGVSPYRYSVYYGGGSINSSGVFEAPQSEGLVILKVVDAIGASSLYSLKIWKAPLAPNGISLIIPEGSSWDDMPTLRVAGVVAGNMIEIYTDATCTTLVGSGVASNGTVDVTLFESLLPGSYNFYASQKDSSGHRSQCSVISTNYSFIPPGLDFADVYTDGSGTKFIGSQQVDLIISSGSAAEMKISNDASCSSGSWVPYSNSVTGWSLPNGDGLKEVSLMLRTAGLVNSPCAKATIIVDTTAPTAVSNLLVGGYGSMVSTPGIGMTPATDSGSGVRGYEIRILEEPGGSLIKDWVLADLSPLGLTNLSELVESGEYKLEIRAVDNVGNRGPAVASASSWIAILNPMVGFGSNASGQMGFGAGSIYTPIQTPLSEFARVAGGHNFSKVVTSGMHSCGLSAGGDIYCWGRNNAGQIGDGTQDDRYGPTLVDAGVLQFKDVAAGSAFTCALTTDGKPYCWGQGCWLSLFGTGSCSMNTPWSKSPRLIDGSISFEQISASDEYHACALTAGGAAYCWGRDYNGVLGVGGGVGGGSKVPLPVSGGHVFQKISSAYSSSCGLTTDNDVYCWGYGRNGNGSSYGYRPNPVKLISSDKFMDVAAGGGQICVLTLVGQAQCWGWNTEGQIGDGTTEERLTPVVVSGGLTFSKIYAAEGYTCGIAADSETYCWGARVAGKLGIMSALSTYTPQHVQTPLPLIQLGLSSQTNGHATCGVSASGEAYCWGDSRSGQIGNGLLTTTMVTSPAVSKSLIKFTRISAGSGFSCGLTEVGKAYCWGSNSSGRLGDSSTYHSDSPVPVSGDFRYSKISAGGAHACAIRSDDNAILCWGSNTSGQLGNGANISSNVPVLVSGGHAFVEVATGNDHSCGISTSGYIYCWGENVSGQLGNGTTVASSAPVPTSGSNSYHRITAGTGFTCAIATTTNRAFCWGANSRYELGIGNTALKNVPTAVFGGRSFKEIASFDYRTCALDLAGNAYCWGHSTTGMTSGGSGSGTTPVLVLGGRLYKEISPAINHTCALTVNGAAYCWGYGTDGQLGQGDVGNSPVALPVLGGLRFSTLKAGNQFNIGLLE